MNIDSKLGKTVLTVAHVAGMIDMVALPLWVGTLMQRYHYSPSQAGGVVTAFLAAVALASVAIAPRFGRLPRWLGADAGFALATVAFWIAHELAVGPDSLLVMVAVHAVAGLGVGCALSQVDGSIGRTRNPHRMFGFVNLAIALFGTVFLGGVPLIIENFGPAQLFLVFTIAMAIPAVICFLGFPRDQHEPIDSTSSNRASRVAWLVIFAIVFMTFNQSMVFSFVERIGAARGFEPAKVRAVLIALGLVNLIPGPLAAMLQKRFAPLKVGIGGALCQATLAMILSHSVDFQPYAVAVAFYVSVMIFTHTFLFGLLSRLDPTGRTVAGTPAMIMIGSCAGPAIGGAIVQTTGYPGLGLGACAASLMAIAWLTLASHAMRASTSADVATSLSQ